MRKSLKLRLIKITNYQSIRSLTLRLGAFTVLVGRSDQGKSAVLRAVRDVFTNPAGKDVITIGQTKMSVVLGFDDGTVIEYGRAAYPYYKMRGPINVEYQKVGRDVPPEVQMIARKWAVAGVDPMLVCIQQQSDPPFLLGVSRSHAERALNLLDAQVFSIAHTKCESTVRSLKREVNQLALEQEKWASRVQVLLPVEKLVAEQEAARKVQQSLIGLLVSRLRVPDLRPMRLGVKLLVLCKKVAYPARIPYTGLLKLTALSGRVEAPAKKNWQAPMKLTVLREVPNPVDVQPAWLAVGLLGLLDQEKLAFAELKDIQRQEEEVTAELFAEGLCPLCGQVVAQCSH